MVLDTVAVDTLARLAISRISMDSEEMLGQQKHARRMLAHQKNALRPQILRTALSFFPPPAKTQFSGRTGWVVIFVAACAKPSLVASTCTGPDWPGSERTMSSASPVNAVRWS